MKFKKMDSVDRALFGGFGWIARGARLVNGENYDAVIIANNEGVSIVGLAEDGFPRKIYKMEMLPAKASLALARLLGGHPYIKVRKLVSLGFTEIK